MSISVMYEISGLKASKLAGLMLTSIHIYAVVTS